MNVVYTAHGFLPAHSMGGPRKIVALLLDEAAAQADPEMRVYLLANRGVFEGARWQQPSPGFKAAPLASIATVGRRLKHQGPALPLQLVNATAHTMLRRHVPPVQLLRSTLTYADACARKHWAELRTKLGQCVVHSHLNTGAVPILASRDAARQKVVCTYNSKGSIVSDYISTFPGIDQHKLGHTVRMRERVELQAADVVTFASKGARDLMAQHHPGVLDSRDVRIVYNGVEVRKIDALRAEQPRRARSLGDPLTIINVAQHVAQKRFDVLLRSVAAIKDELPVRLICVGSGPLLEEHRKLAADLGIADQVEFRGARPNQEVLELLLTGDLYLLPSENVVFDLVTLEAMAAGIPVVVSADGGNFECIRDGVDGILAPVGDVRRVTEAIRFVAANPERAGEMVASARARVSTEFSVTAMLNNYKRIYEELAV